jgi:hypothetical protein
MTTGKSLEDGAVRVIRGKRMAFEGEAQAFTRRWFNVDAETFAFDVPAKLKDDQTCVDVTELFVAGIESHTGKDFEWRGRGLRLYPLIACSARDFGSGLDPTTSRGCRIYTATRSHSAWGIRPSAKLGSGKAR